MLLIIIINKGKDASESYKIDFLWEKAQAGTYSAGSNFP